MIRCVEMVKMELFLRSVKCSVWKMERWMAFGDPKLNWREMEDFFRRN